MENKEWYSSQLGHMAATYGIKANPVTGLKWKARAGLFAMPKLNGAVMSFMACLIDHAHEDWGFGFPSRAAMQRWTGRSERTIDRAVAKAKELELVQAIERRLSYDKSDPTIYVINWKLLFAAYDQQQRRKRRSEIVRNRGPKLSERTDKSGKRILVSDPRIKEPCTSPSGEASDEHREICSEPKRHQSENGIQADRIGEGPTAGDDPAEPMAYDDPRIAALERRRQMNGKCY